MYCVLIFYMCFVCLFFFFFKQKTAYEMRISDWSSDVCSSDLSCSSACLANSTIRIAFFAASAMSTTSPIWVRTLLSMPRRFTPIIAASRHIGTIRMIANGSTRLSYCAARSEEHTSELQSLMRNSYAVFCLKKKKKNDNITKLKTLTQKQYIDV